MVNFPGLTTSLAQSHFLTTPAWHPRGEITCVTEEVRRDMLGAMGTSKPALPIQLKSAAPGCHVICQYRTAQR